MFFYIIIITGILLDFITKYIIQIKLQNQINILGDFLFLKYVENNGIAFSIQIKFIKLITIILIIGIFCYYFIERKKIKNKKLFDLSFGLILSGAIGNGIGRIIDFFVIDFIGIKYFAIFNLADIFITIGVLIYLYLLTKKNNVILT